MTAIDDDLVCTACGYLLRGLDAGGRCPECSLPVTDSRAAAEAAAAGRPTRRSIRFLAAATAMLAAVILAWPYVQQFAFSGYATRILSFYLNPDGTRYLLVACCCSCRHGCCAARMFAGRARGHRI
jgi:predicted amidophosphoribosyltransferase